MYDMKKFFWDEPYLYQSCADVHFRHCVPEMEMLCVLEAFHSSSMGGHDSGIWTTHKICAVGIIGQPLLKMLMTLPSYVIGVRYMEEFWRGESSLYIPF